MSKQLALSSTFATFAMAALVLFHTPDRSGLGGGDAFMPVQAEAPQIDHSALDLPQPSFFE